MTAGVLQLFAKGVQDIYLTGNPTITFFKTVYRRHTHFTKDEINLTFTNTLDFDKEGYCRIEHFGDLLHRLFLRIKIPTVDISYKKITVKEIESLLRDYYSINWSPSTKSEIDDDNEYSDQIFELIDEKVKRVEQDIVTYKNLILEVEEIIYGKKKNKNIISTLFKYEEYGLLYNIIEALIKDIRRQNNIIPVINDVQVHNMVLKELKKYIFNNNGLSNSFNDINMKSLFFHDSTNLGHDAHKIFENLGLNIANEETDKLVLNGLRENIRMLRHGFNNDNNIFLSQESTESLSSIRNNIGLSTMKHFIEMSKVVDIDKYLEQEEKELEECIENYDKNKHFLIEAINNHNDKLPYLITYEDLINLYNLPKKVRKVLSSKDHQNVKPRNTVLDVINYVTKIVKAFLNSDVCPFMETDKYIYKLWSQNHKKFDPILEMDKFNRLFHNLFQQNELSQYKLQIETLFNNFSSDIDILSFMKSYIIQSSDYLVNIEAYVSHPSKLVKLFNDKIESSRSLLNKIQGDPGQKIVSLKTIIRRSLFRSNSMALPSFSWIKRLGHYLIDSTWFQIDDYVIDKHYGEWLNIWHDLSKNKKKEKGYNELIGDVKEMTRYNSLGKEGYELIIPLNFWFCRNIGISLPLIALHNSTIRLYVKLRPLDQVSFFEAERTVFRKKVKLDCSVIAEYIYVEQEERRKFVSSKLEYLIQYLQYNGEIHVGKHNIINDKKVEIVSRFKGLTKELFWLFQDLNHVKNKQYYKYDYLGINPIKSAKITFNGRVREHYKDITYYNNAVPYERHSSSGSIGLNAYSFSLEAESTQAYGHANLTEIEEVGIHCKLTKKVIKAMNSGVTFRVPVYALCTNVWRVYGGVSGLVFEC
ncbi:MAG: NCLDV major capsid protein [Barrevirus sp.]|uniref:NCLDV major capsid protein n=1 Tax=Barrevirus sp. TaxID=2487763 RepID=A0A3G4ZUR3_9VIRU|nr:MAG: NCLDV major capsid protein [Barrevirus sp.]